MNIEKDFEELYEGWKKGKYKITDDKGNIIGKYSSGSKAQKVVDDLMQQGKYDKLTVEIIEDLEKEASTYRDKQKKSKDKKQFGISRKKSNVRHGGSGYGEEIDENKIVIGGKELDREWTGWWWRKNEKWTVVDGKNNMLASAKSSGEAEKWMKKLKDASQTRGDFSLAIGNPKLMLNHGQFGMPGLDFDKIFKSVNKDPDQLTIRKIDKKDHDRYFERAKKVNKKYDYTNLELTYDGGRKHYAPKKVKEEIGEAYKDLPPHLQKLVKKIEKKQKDWNKQNPNAKIKTLVYNPDTGKPDIEIKENTMKLEDTVKQVLTGKPKLEEHCGVCDEQGIEEDSDKDEPGTQGDMKKYQAARAKVMKKFGVKSCSELEGDEKKACYAALDAAHVSDDEEEKGEKKEEVKKTYSKMFSHIKSLMQGK